MEDEHINYRLSDCIFDAPEWLLYALDQDEADAHMVYIENITWERGSE